MEYSKALEVNEILRRQSAHFKDLDITAQTTQLNSLRKYADLETSVPQKAILQQLITHRQKRLALSIEVMSVLELHCSSEISLLEEN